LSCRAGRNSSHSPLRPASASALPLASHATAKIWIFRILVVVIGGEIVHLAVHYFFQTA
jgi:hypothetical protein